MQSCTIIRVLDLYKLYILHRIRWLHMSSRDSDVEKAGRFVSDSSRVCTRMLSTEPHGN